MQHNTDATLCTDSTIKRGNKNCNNICVCVFECAKKKLHWRSSRCCLCHCCGCRCCCSNELSLSRVPSLSRSHPYTCKRPQGAVESTTRSLACSRCAVDADADAGVATHTHTLALRSLSKSKFQVRLLQFIREFCCVLHSFLSWLITALQNNSMPYRAIPFHSSLPLSLSLWPPAHQSVNFCFYVSCGPFNCANCATQPSQILVENETGFLFACFLIFISPHFAVFSVFFLEVCLAPEQRLFVFFFAHLTEFSECSFIVVVVFHLISVYFFYFILFPSSAICF